MINEIPDENVDAVLMHYLELPETPIKASFKDRHTATKLLESGISLPIIESAFLLATLRRLGRSADMPPLSPIRSLAYFLPVIQEILNNPIPEDYLSYLRIKVRSLSSGNKSIARCI
jgi:hypothetical protein